jgi:thiamine transport system permease protein
LGFDSNRSIIQKISFIAVAVFLISPFLILLTMGEGAAWPESQALVEVLEFTLLQALASAFASVVLGVLAAGGLIRLSQVLSQPMFRVAVLLTALPNAAPVIVILLAVMKFLPGLRGASGIIGVHTLLNTGIVAIALSRIASEKLATAADLAWIEGASRLRFLRAALPMLKTEITGLFLFVFALCFASFAVPLVIGGSRATVLEVLIYEKIRIEGNWPQALGLSFIQLACVLVLSVLLSRESRQGNSVRPTRAPLLNFVPGFVLALAPAALIFAALLDRPWVGMSQLFANRVLVDEVIAGLKGTLIVGVSVFFFVTLALEILAYADPQGRARKVVLGYAAPTAVLTGFAMLIFWRELGFASYIKIATAITLVSVPALYRFRLDGELQSLKAQRDIALTLGANSWLTFSKVIYPQIAKSVMVLAGLAMIWSLGDFALSGVIAEKNLTLAMTVQSLMGSYRLDIASFLILIMMLLVGLLLGFSQMISSKKESSNVSR